jgi:hypothetical protein
MVSSVACHNNLDYKLMAHHVCPCVRLDTFSSCYACRISLLKQRRSSAHPNSESADSATRHRQYHGIQPIRYCEPRWRAAAVVGGTNIRMQQASCSTGTLHHNCSLLAAIAALLAHSRASRQCYITFLHYFACFLHSLDGTHCRRSPAARLPSTRCSPSSRAGTSAGASRTYRTLSSRQKSWTTSLAPC